MSLLFSSARLIASFRDSGIVAELLMPIRDISGSGGKGLACCNGMFGSGGYCDVSTCPVDGAGTAGVDGFGWVTPGTVGCPGGACGAGCCTAGGAAGLGLSVPGGAVGGGLGLGT